MKLEEKRPSPNSWTTEYFPYTNILPHITKNLFTAVHFKKYNMPGYQEKIMGCLGGSVMEVVNS